MNHHLLLLAMLLLAGPRLGTRQPLNDEHFTMSGYDLLGQQVAMALKSALR